MKTLIKNVRAAVTCDDSDRVLHGCDVLLDGGKIAALGRFDGTADRVLDGAGMFAYPGLVNTHHHLYQYFTRNLARVQGLPLFPWLTALYELWAKLDENTVLASSLAGMGELLKYGCTTCFDHHYVFPKGAGDVLAAQFEAARQLGVRMVASRGSMSLSKKDGGLPPDSVVQTVDEILKDSQNAIERYHDASAFSMRQVVLAPCSPFSVTADLLSESVKLARAYKVRLHTHLAETLDEERFTFEKFGLRPLAYMERVGMVGADVFFAHGIHFNDGELKLLAATGTGVSHCPASNMKLSSGAMRLPDMLSLDVPVGLAVDGSASNDASNLLAEIRTGYLLHRHAWGGRAPSGYEILKLATRGGARLLGRPELGQIAEGMAADLFLIDSRRFELLCADGDEKNLFGAVGYARPVDYVFVAGEMVVENGVLTRADEAELRARGDAELARLYS